MSATDDPVTESTPGEVPTEDHPIQMTGTEIVARRWVPRTVCVLTQPSLQFVTSLAIVGVAIFVTQIPIPAGPNPPSPDGSSPPNLSSPLSIGLNSSDVRELSLLPGIGPKLADRIVQHRESHGPFRSVEGLSAVHGVGPKLLHSLRPWVHVSQPATTTPDPIFAPDRLVSQVPGTDRFDDFGGVGHDERRPRVASGRLSN
ncbi:MAG: ComEA family DNA-binding protein [Rhodopirellula sp. JB055]|uniref:ComEA family DNA-binding protein n=1 Tax=Rhodopirellula sp. JB055 TaxID=3342846 RepID=UPI003709D5EA